MTRRSAMSVLFILLASAAGLTARAGNPVANPPAVLAEPSAAMIQLLGPGDVIKISFPGAPNLETTQQIRRDGKINLSIVGEVPAADRSPSQLEHELLQLFAAHVVSREIKVTVVSSAFAVFVSGAVMNPGKITPSRAVTVLEAIMEAGGFDLVRANTKSVRVIRHEGGKVTNFTVNLKGVLDGKPSEAFYLKSHDIVFVPEKFAWF